tara:strand:+ start:1214 stop:1963 length:750 start_codon:yes stop_codon:yes gene_type:complete
MIEYFDFLALIPAVFFIPALPFVKRRFFAGVDSTKFSYGAATSGILLTFFGIWQGLIGFDIANYADSLPPLIEGLKTAFGSSIVGLFTSMMINILFVKSKDDVEESLERMAKSLNDLRSVLDNFAHESSKMQTTALLDAMKKLVDELEMGINTETKETMTRFRESVDFLRKWQEKYVDEILAVTDAMDKNAIVTQTTTEQLDRTNDVLAELGPVTEQIAASIGWVQTALPSFRKVKTIKDPKQELKDEE